MNVSVDWTMVLLVLGWWLYASLVVAVARSWQRRTRRMRRQLAATRHVVAAPEHETLRRRKVVAEDLPDAA